MGGGGHAGKTARGGGRRSTVRDKVTNAGYEVGLGLLFKKSRRAPLRVEPVTRERGSEGGSEGEIPRFGMRESGDTWRRMIAWRGEPCGSIF